MGKPISRRIFFHKIRLIIGDCKYNYIKKTVDFDDLCKFLLIWHNVTYDVTAATYMECWYFIWYSLIEDRWIGVIVTALGKICCKKYLGRTRVNFDYTVAINISFQSLHSVVPDCTKRVLTIPYTSNSWDQTHYLHTFQTTTELNQTHVMLSLALVVNNKPHTLYNDKIFITEPTLHHQINLMPMALNDSSKGTENTHLHLAPSHVT